MVIDSCGTMHMYLSCHSEVRDNYYYSAWVRFITMLIRSFLAAGACMHAAVKQSECHLATIVYSDCV